jgi:putative toxin-antitoxin system antitoxin component (TIGR02293 family)
MLTNYDAKAVAEVMGLAFLRSARDESSPTPTSKASKARPKHITGAHDHDIVIHIGGDTMLIVEAKSTDILASRVTSKSSSRHPSALANRSVSPPTPILIEKAVEQGLPRTALRHVAEWLAGGDKTKIATLEWGVVPKTTLERRETQLSPQESERTERVARLSVHARRTLGTEAEAREFMTTPHPELDGRSPIDAAMTDLGTRRAEQILNAIEYGLAL